MGPNAPRRHCCDILPSSAGKTMEISIRQCREEELIYMHPLNFRPKVKPRSVICSSKQRKIQNLKDL
ncbi:hypothetical protein ACSBR2_027643 [Camellia fascicularis]